MADLAGRLRAVERKLDFLMSNLRMRAAIQSGLLGPDGNPAPPRVFEGSMKELYALAREIPVAGEDEFHQAAEAAPEAENG